MKTYKYIWPYGETIVTEDEIIEEFYDFWVEKMKKVNKEHLISRELCINDFIVVHWAWEIDEHTKENIKLV